ncbi:MAG: copper-binding protein [Phycisphaerales bacterium]|nr:copper-binding protein [Phycisphaerales bacterium]
MTSTRTRMIPSALALIAGLALVGCSDANSNSSNAPQSGVDAHHDHDGHDHGDENRAPDVYSGIRGEIATLPNPEVPGSELQIHHEQIPEFKTSEGVVNITADGIAGMRSMTMPFPLAEGVSLDGFAVGDKVEFEFVVNWGGNRPAWEVTKLTKLPAETELNFENAIVENFEQMKDQAHDMMDHSGHDHGEGEHDEP